MRTNPLSLITLLLFYGITVNADCTHVIKETFSGVFQITSVNKELGSMCAFDANGVFLNHSIKIPVRGCVVELSILKLDKKNKLPTLNSTNDNKIKIYSESIFCEKRIGTKLQLKVQSTTSECCALSLAQKGSEYQFCTTGPTPKLIKELPEENIRCNSDGRSWKVIGEK